MIVKKDNTIYEFSKIWVYDIEERHFYIKGWTTGTDYFSNEILGYYENRETAEAALKEIFETLSKNNGAAEIFPSDFEKLISQ